MTTSPPRSRTPRRSIWVDVTGPEHIEIDDIGQLLDLHPLIAEDIAERNQRAKIEEIGETFHIVLFSIVYEGEIAEREIDLVLNHRSLLTVHEPGWDPFRTPQLRGDPGAVLKRGPDFLLYALTDAIVDDYFPVLDCDRGRDRRAPGRRHRAPQPVDAAAAVLAQAPADRRCAGR